jgi:hypothetical protein
MPGIEELVRVADEIRARSGPQTTDSVDLIRKNRDRGLSPEED